MQYTVTVYADYVHHLQNLQYAGMSTDSVMGREHPSRVKYTFRGTSLAVNMLDLSSSHKKLLYR